MKIIAYNESNFNQILSENSIVILKFSTKWCRPCKILHEQMVSDPSDNVVIECDIDDNEDFASTFNISDIPHVVFFKNGLVQSEYVNKANLELIKKVCDKYKTKTL